MTRLSLGLLALTLSTGCYLSHSPLEPVDAGPDSRVDTGRDASVDRRDAGDDAGTLAPLVGVTQEGSIYRFYDVRFDAEPRMLAELPSAFLPLVDFRTGPSGHLGLLVSGGETFRRTTLLEWARGGSTEVFDELAVASEGQCERRSGQRFAWRADGRALFVECVRRDAGGRRQESAVYEVPLDGQPSRLTDGCAGLYFTTADSRVVVGQAPDCDTAFDLLVIDPESRDVDFVASGAAPHFWLADPAGAVLSSVSFRDENFDYNNLRHVGIAGVESVWGSIERSRLFPMSPDGAILVEQDRVLRIREPGGLWTESTVPPCEREGRQVRWAPDGSAFALRCEGTDWMVQRDGSWLGIAAEGLSNDYTWSEDLQLLRGVLGDARVHWEQIDPNSTLRRRILPLDALGALAAAWRYPASVQLCGLYVDACFESAAAGD